MGKYKHLKNDFVTYGVRDLSRGKLTEAVKTSLSEPVVVMKNNKKQSVLISYNEYIKLLNKNHSNVTEKESKKFEEFSIDCSYDVPKEWEIKFESYDLKKYIADIENYGIKNTWKYICNYVYHKDKVISFLNVSNFGELYEIALAKEDKNLKKENGKYYTPEDVALLMSNWFKDIDAYNVCDVACGTGKLILTYLDLIGYDESVKLLEEGRLYLYDIDETALKICLISILLKYGKKHSNKIHAFNCDFLDKNIHLPQNCKVIANPPYAEISVISNNWIKSKIQLETKELYSCFMEKIILESKCSVIITPYSFIGGKKFYSLRLLMNDYSGFIVSFDNVPGNIFCGRKHGIFNTNTSNSVRATITVVKNDGVNKGFRLTPLIRFKNEERDKLLNCNLLESNLSNNYQIVGDNNNAYIKCHKELKVVFDEWINKSTRSLKDVISPKAQNYQIHIPNTCRYFTTASSYKLKRAGKIVLGFENEELFNFVYCLINSSFVYWWWRVYDGGITYPKELLYKIPIFNNLLCDDDKKFFKDITHEMIKMEKDCIVTKLNSGKIQENVKFPLKYREKINKKLLEILGFYNLETQVFDVLHKNSYFEM